MSNDFDASAAEALEQKAEVERLRDAASQASEYLDSIAYHYPENIDEDNGAGEDPYHWRRVRHYVSLARGWLKGGNES